MNYYTSTYTITPSTNIIPEDYLILNYSENWGNANATTIATALNLTLLPTFTTEQPTNTSIQVVEKDNTGNLYMTWMESSDYANTQADLKASTIYRIRRNALLAASDWTQMPDVPANTSIKWATYRQELRDITSQNTFPRIINWPVKPDN